MKQLMILLLLHVVCATAEYIAYQQLGCFDGSGGVYRYMWRVLRSGNEEDAILRCYEAAREKKYKAFAITDGKYCRSGPYADRHVNNIPKATGCSKNGLGGRGVGNIYKIEGGDSCKTMADGEYQDSQFCNSFVTCHNHKLYRQVCPEGLLFKASTRQCEAYKKCPKGTTDCSPSQMIVNVPCPYGMVCRHPVHDGEYAHPESCRRYVVCHRKAAFEMICPGNLWFNQRTRQCESSLTANCAHNPCSQDVNPCLNGGECSYVDPGNGATYQCKCKEGYEGTHCETHAPRPCNANPCKNGGTCAELKGNKYKCKCPSGFRGKNCEETFGRGIEKSKIIGKNAYFVSQLETWLRATPGGYDRYWIKCFDTSENGWASTTFHSRCDDRGPSVVIVRTNLVGHEYFFGGYTYIGWKSASRYKRDDNAFLFTLKNKDNLPPQKLKPYRYFQNAIYCSSSYGPTFGAGHDLYIYNNAGYNKNSYSNLGYTYKTPNGYTHGTTKAQEFLAGSYKFTPLAYEVFYAVHRS